MVVYAGALDKIVAVFPSACANALWLDLLPHHL